MKIDQRVILIVLAVVPGMSSAHCLRDTQATGLVAGFAHPFNGGGRLLGSKAGWVPVHAQSLDKFSEAYPDESLAEWYRRHGLEQAEP